MEGETGERDDEGADVKDLERGYKRIYGNGADEDAEEIERDPDQENGQRKIKNMLLSPWLSYSIQTVSLKRLVMCGVPTSILSSE